MTEETKLQDLQDSAQANQANHADQPNQESVGVTTEAFKEFGKAVRALKDSKTDFDNEAYVVMGLSKLKDEEGKSTEQFKVVGALIGRQNLLTQLVQAILEEDSDMNELLTKTILKDTIEQILKKSKD